MDGQVANDARVCTAQTARCCLILSSVLSPLEDDGIDASSSILKCNVGRYLYFRECKTDSFYLAILLWQFPGKIRSNTAEKGII